MLVHTKTSWSLLIAAVLAIGCSKPPASPTPASPTSEGGTGTPAAAVPEGSKVVCHLECSGTEATGQGATEAEARADVSQYIEQNCKPEDGQYFLFCDPPQ